jgi:hypothetical protein
MKAKGRMDYQVLEKLGLNSTQAGSDHRRT